MAPNYEGWVASLRRHPRSPYFIACFTGGDGARYQRSTKVASDGKVESRRRAQKIADEYEDVARGIRTAQQVQTVVQELYQRATGQALEVQTTRFFASEWLKDKKGTVEPRTHHFYKTRIDSFQLFLKERADLSLNLISEKDVREWRDGEAERVTPTTVNLGLKVVRMFLGSAAKRNLVGENVAARVPILKKKQGVSRRPFSVDELQKLLPVLPKEWKSLVLFGLYTGQRLGDLARLKWSDIDLGLGEIRFVTKKTGRAQKIPIAPPLRQHIESLPTPIQSELYIHPVACGFTVSGKHGNVSTLSRQFHDLMAQAGIVPKRMHRKREGKVANQRNASALTFHGLRHTLTSMLKNAGVSSSVAEEIIGHDSSEMNRIYTHIDHASLVKAMSLLPAIGGV